VEFADGYIINPLNFRTGTLYVSPFESNDAHINRQIWSESSENYDPIVDFEGKLMSVTESCTKALELVLRDLRLKPDDEVWIVTTSGNKYISGCVTGTIEMFCRYSREKTDKTAAILVNHEFGFLYKEINRLIDFGLPIIEDKAYSMYSLFEDDAGNFAGDYTVFSMAKMFPIQAGGLIYSKKGLVLQDNLPPDAVKYHKACFLNYHSKKEYIIRKRNENYNLMTFYFEQFGFSPRFIPERSETPGAFLFNAQGIDLSGLKTYLQRQGIECSVFYGEEAFYLPCHQKMNKQHIEYIITLIRNFLK